MASALRHPSRRFTSTRSPPWARTLLHERLRPEAAAREDSRRKSSGLCRFPRGRNVEVIAGAHPAVPAARHSSPGWLVGRASAAHLGCGTGGQQKNRYGRSPHPDTFGFHAPHGGIAQGAPAGARGTVFCHFPQPAPGPRHLGSRWREARSTCSEFKPSRLLARSAKDEQTVTAGDSTDDRDEAQRLSSNSPYRPDS